MNVYSDPAFVAAEMEYRYGRDHVTTVHRPRAPRPRLATIWHRVIRHHPADLVDRTVSHG